MNRTILEDSWLRLLYVLDGVGVRHYEPVGSMFRAGDEVQVARTALGISVEGYGLHEVWAQLAKPKQEVA